MTVVRSKYPIRENHLYETESWATEVLLRNVSVHGIVWEPSAGNHKIADVLSENNLRVVTSDIATYDRKHDNIIDFYDPAARIPVCDWIVTNPPYGAGNRLAVRYAELALQRAKNVALLLTAKFDFGKTRTHLFRDNPYFYGKLNLMDRLSFFDGKTGTEDHAWYIWTSNAVEFPRLMYGEKV